MEHPIWIIILMLFAQQNTETMEVKEIEEPEVATKEVEICAPNSTFVSFMDYRAITNTSSEQYRLQQQAYTDDKGNRMIGEYRLVATAERYAPLGSKYILTLESGSQVKVMIGDIKANRECTHEDTSMIEAIVDTRLIPEDVWVYGSITDMRERVIKMEREIK